jgi:hypothetical protein
MFVPVFLMVYKTRRQMAYLTAGVDRGERPLDDDVVYAVEVKINNVLLIGVYRILFCLIRDGYSMHYGGHGIRFKIENFMRISMDNGILVPRACDPREGTRGSGIIRCRKPRILAKIELRTISTANQIPP